MQHTAKSSENSLLTKYAFTGFLTLEVCLFLRRSVDTCIILVENSVPSREPFSVANFRDEADVFRLSEAFQENAFSMHTCDLSPNGWALTSSKVLRLLEKLENIGTPLGEYVDGFYRGVGNRM